MKHLGTGTGIGSSRYLSYYNLRLKCTANQIGRWVNQIGNKISPRLYIGMRRKDEGGVARNSVANIPWFENMKIKGEKIGEKKKRDEKIGSRKSGWMMLKIQTRAYKHTPNMTTVNVFEKLKEGGEEERIEETYQATSQL